MMTLLRFKLTLLACLFLTAQFASAVTLRGQVGTNHVLREFFYVGPAANVIAYSLNNTEGTAPTKYSSFIKRDGAFLLELPDPVAWPVTDSEETATVNPSKSDVYLLKFHVRALQFDQYRVDVRPARKSGQQPVISIRPHNPQYPISASLYLSDPLPSPFIVHPRQVYSYFHSIQDFNALNYLWMTLKSPIILMSLGAWAMVSLMPKLMANLDPEEAAQMAKNQAQMADRMAALQSGDWKGIVGDSPSERAPAAAAAAGGSGAKKRK